MTLLLIFVDNYDFSLAFDLLTIKINKIDATYEHL
jgi:hypothetical protein